MKIVPSRMEEAEFSTPKGRRAAWRSLLLQDHGVLREVYDNTHRLGDRAYRTFQPSPRQVRRWADRGIRTIVNLRGTRRGDAQPGFYWLEREAAQAAGIAFVDFRAYSREAPKREFVLGLDRLFGEIAYPALLHCKSGADRAGLAATLFLFLHEGKSLDEAQEQLSFRYGHVRHGKTGVLDAFFAAYRRHAAETGTVPNREHFLTWIERDYDPDALNESFRANWLGSLLTERILRRE